MKLTIKAIIRWEQMNKKPFADIDYTKNEDIETLFYVCSLSNNAFRAFAEFRESLNEEAIKIMVADFEKETSIASQFKQPTKEIPSEDTGDTTQDQPVPIWIKDVIPYLIMGGLDARYALNDMELIDLPLYIDAHERRTKEKLESERLWAFMQLMPHLKPGIKSARDFYPFPWELEENKKNAAASIEENKDMFESFMQSGKTLLNKSSI